MIHLVALLAPALLITGHIWGATHKVKEKKYTEFTRSFAAGISVSYVFLILLPEVIKRSNGQIVEVMTLILIGFTIFHSVLKFVFISKDTKKHKAILVDEIHVFTTGIYNFLLAFLVTESIIINVQEGILVLLFLLVHTVLSELSDPDMINTKVDSFKLPIIIISILIGSTLALTGFLEGTIITFLFALSAGAIIYISTREEVPNETSEKPHYFIFGVVIFLLFFRIIF